MQNKSKHGLSLLKNTFFYFSITLVSTLAGALIGVICGFGLGWLLSLSYQRRGPGDPADAPVYVALGLALVGTGLGAIGGFAGGIALCVLKAGRRVASRQSGPPPPPSVDGK